MPIAPTGIACDRGSKRDYLEPGLPDHHDRVVHLTDRFRSDTEDRVWMAALAEEDGWVVISADRRIYRNRLEREAWRRSRLIVFFLAPQRGKVRNIEIAWRLSSETWGQSGDKFPMLPEPLIYPCRRTALSPLSP